jgi:O-antigen/teichoic acid export membrane protein
MSGFNRLLKNSVANIINGFSNVILGIVISPFLLSCLTLEQFSIWSLSLQTGAFVSLLGFGSQLAVGRFTSLAKFNNDPNALKNLISNATLLSVFSLLLSVIAIVVVYYNFGDFFKEVSASGYESSRLSFLIVSLSFSFGLISSVFTGYFIGVERNDITASINLLSRVVLGGAVVFASKYGLLAMSIVYFLINLISYVLVFVAYIKVETFDIPFKVAAGMKALISFCSGLAIWNLAQFFISGVGGFVVAKYDFSNLAYYMLAISLINAIVGVLGAVTNPIIQPIVRLNSLHRQADVEQLVIDVSMLFSLVIIIGVVLSHYISEFVLTAWIGAEKAIHTNVIFNYLLVSFSIRMVIAPYGMKLISEGKQLKVSHYPIFEGLSNFILAIFFVKYFGAVGIAYSTIVSALITMFAYSVRCKRECLTLDNNSTVLMPFFILPCTAVAGVFLLDYFNPQKPMAQFFIFLQLFVLFFVILKIRRLTYAIKNVINSI